MKKLLSLALALVLCLGLTIPALAVGKIGDTTVTDSKGNVYTLSQPIIQVYSREDIDEIPFSEDYSRLISDDEFEEVKPTDSLLSQAKMAYEVPVGTVVTAPNKMGFFGFGLVELDLVNDEPTAVLETMEPPYLKELELDYRELGWYNTFWVLECYTEKEDESGPYPGDHIDDIVFYTSKTSVPTTSTAPKATSNVFTDVADSAYYAEPVKWAVEKNITGGTTATTFSPNQTCSTAQILTFLWRSKGSPEPTSKTNPFTDVKESAYYYKAALWAKENEVLPRPFKPELKGDAPCTRGMAMLYIWKAAGSHAAEKKGSFADVSSKSLYAPAVDWAVETGVTGGTTATTFSPDATCTRGQIVTFLYRAFAQK